VAASPRGWTTSLIDHYPLTHVKSSIVALNSTTERGYQIRRPDVSSASIFSDGFNLDGIKDATGAGFNKPTDKTGTVGSPLDPQVDTFGFHGGPDAELFTKRRRAPRSMPASATPSRRNQRGIGFPRTSDDGRHRQRDGRRRHRYRLVRTRSA
jgi:hypothetical protein